MVKINPFNWLTATMRGSLKDDAIPGTLWNAGDTKSNDCTDIRSFNGTGSPRRVCFRNRSDSTILLCWVDDKGNPHHFHPLPPYTTKHRIRGGDVIITDNDHVENTWEGHAFLLAACDDVELVRQEKSLKHAVVVGGYRPESGHTHSDEAKAQLVEVFTPGRSVGDLLICCRPSKRALDAPEASIMDSAPALKVRVRLGMIDPTPIDTTQKPYDPNTLAEWPVRVEPDSLKDHVREAIVEDLQEMQRCLPEHAVKALRENTPIWINKSLKYGPKACPITAKGMCFHPGSEWLDNMGMCTEKCECVELYNADDYCTDRPLWGVGGLLIHEFSHAYHHKCCEDGYENKLIKECYEQAMKEGLYDLVEVHGRQGPKAKAYACTNQMEYFAELSTAFLGGAPERLKDRGDDNDCEFNKWYPFNRSQVQKHDPRAFEMLKTIWKIE